MKKNCDSKTRLRTDKNLSSKSHVKIGVAQKRCIIVLWCFYPYHVTICNPKSFSVSISSINTSLQSVIPIMSWC